MLTNKENYMRVLRREIPESIPQAAYQLVYPAVLKKDRNPDLSGFDYFGVEYVVSAESGFANGFIPKPGVFMIEDITKWRDIVKIPDLSDVDWEQMAKKDLAQFDRERGPIMTDSVTGFFQALINFMGFTEGLCACFEEPEEVKAMMETICDFHVGVAKNLIKYYKPDALWLPDDVATARAPFISLEMFRELFLPSWKRYVDVFLNAGIPAQLHCCGECGILIDDFVECGFSAWDPAQVMNDLKGIKAKHGNKLAFVGGFDSAPLLAPDVTEEFTREYVRQFIADFAPGGGLVWTGGLMMAAMGKPELQERAKWVREEFEALAPNYYGA